MMTSFRPILNTPRFGVGLKLESTLDAVDLSQAQAKPFQAALDLIAEQTELCQAAAALDDRESPVTVNIAIENDGTVSADFINANRYSVAPPLSQKARESAVDFVKRAIASLAPYCAHLSQVTQRRQDIVDKTATFAQEMLTAAASGPLAKGSKPQLVSLGGKEYKINMSSVLSGNWQFEYTFSAPQKPTEPTLKLVLNKANELTQASINDPRLGYFHIIGGYGCPIQEQVETMKPLLTQLHALLGKLHEQKAYHPTEYGLESFREPKAGESIMQHHGYPYPLNWGTATA